MSQAVEKQVGTDSRWVSFVLGDELYGIDVMQIREVLRSQAISPVPGAPAFVLGIINLRGNVVAIIDTRSRFALPHREVDEASRILILDAGDHVVGFLVDSVREVVQVNGAQVESAPDTGSRESSRFISGLYNRPGGLLILLDGEQLLSDEELEEIAAI